MKNLVGFILFVSGAGAFLAGFIKLVQDPVSLGLVLGGWASIAASIYLFKYQVRKN